MLTDVSLVQTEDSDMPQDVALIGLGSQSSSQARLQSKLAASMKALLMGKV